MLNKKASVKDDLFLCSSNKRPPAKAKKSPVGNWLSFFHLGKSHSVSKRKLKRHPSEPNEIKSIALPGQITAAVTQTENFLNHFYRVNGHYSVLKCSRMYCIEENDLL